MKKQSIVVEEVGMIMWGDEGGWLDWIGLDWNPLGFFFSLLMGRSFLGGDQLKRLYLNREAHDLAPS